MRSSRSWPRAALLLSLAAGPWQPAAAQPTVPAGPSRGELLYATHCHECHAAQLHWRDRRAATDWASLKAQVRHWQAQAFLNWSEADIVEVTRHLNDTIYRFPQTGNRVGLAPPR